MVFIVDRYLYLVIISSELSLEKLIVHIYLTIILL